MKKSPASGHYGDRGKTGRDLGAGSGSQPQITEKAHVKAKKSGPIARGKRGTPTDTGHATGIAKMKGGSGDASRLKGDGVGGPFPSA